MGLNIKNERVHELARRAAKCTGRTQTGAIELALERLLAEYEDAAAFKSERISAAVARAHGIIQELPPMTFEYMNDGLLYNEDGSFR